MKVSVSNPNIETASAVPPSIAWLRSVIKPSEVVSQNISKLEFTPSVSITASCGIVIKGSSTGPGPVGANVNTSLALVPSKFWFNVIL